MSVPPKIRISSTSLSRFWPLHHQSSDVLDESASITLRCSTHQLVKLFWFHPLDRLLQFAIVASIVGLFLPLGSFPAVLPQKRTEVGFDVAFTTRHECSQWLNMNSRVFNNTHS